MIGVRILGRVLTASTVDLAEFWPEGRDDERPNRAAGVTSALGTITAVGSAISHTVQAPTDRWSGHRGRVYRRTGGHVCSGSIGVPHCWRHHRTKQSPGWSVPHDEYGTFTWTSPSGHIWTPNHHPSPSPCPN